MSNDRDLLLTMASVGQIVKLIHVNAGHRMTHRLAELGLTPGVPLTVLQDTGGPILVSVRDSRIALGRGMARKISVEPMDGKNE